MVKTCRKCGEALPLEEFSRKGNGLRSRCKACDSEAWQERKDQMHPPKRNAAFDLLTSGWR